LTGFSWILNETEDYLKGKATAIMVLTLEPANGFSREELGYACWALKDVRGARGALQNPVEHNPKSATSYRYLVSLWSERDLHDQVALVKKLQNQVSLTPQ
jgi:hypothetical protein